MKITNKLRMLALLPATLAVVVIATVFDSAQEIDDARRQERAAGAMVGQAYELESLAYRYLYLSDFGADRPRQQWIAVHDRLAGELSEMTALNNVDHTALVRLHKNHKLIATVFDRLVGVREKLGAATADDTEFLDLQKQNFVRRLLDASFSFRTAALDLAESSHESADATQSAANRLVTIAVLVMVPVLLLFSRLITRSITQPIARLQDGAQIIGQGDLSHRVGSEAKDETGELARAFDHMAQELQTRIDELKRSESEVRAFNETLEQRVEARTRELAEKAAELERQRQTAVTLAEELKLADKAKSEFLANMSHEIRTPMNAVMGLTELVLQSELDDIQRDYLSTVMDSADSLLSVINDILDFSKIEAGMLQFEEIEFQLQDVVGDTVRGQALRAERKDLELTCFVDPGIPDALLGDPGRLRQVLTNLLSNAIKFTESGEVVVRVEQHSNENGHLLLDFLVRDTGIGIEPHKLEAIFEPFEQADMSTTREFGGTGLELAICHRLVSLMGGQIDVDSESGQGSTFRFTAGFQVSDKAKRPASIPEELKGMRVLIVDDNATNRTILEQVLLAKEMAPVTAASALDGFSLLQEGYREGRPFRLLVSDVHMPHIDGFGLAEMIRADDSLADLEILQLTSTGKQGDQKRCQELRIASQMTKPVKQSELYNSMLRALRLDKPTEGGWLSMDDETVERPLPPLRILLVEDSVANQKVALAVLSGAGHTTVVANNGEEALDILAAQEFDVVLMDIQMPVMDGLEATAAIRASEEDTGNHQPIVAMTAHAMSGDRQRCLDAGMDEYVSKPVHQEPLFKAIAVAIGREHGSVPGAGVGKPVAASEKLVDWTIPLSQLRGDHAILKDITESYIKETRENLSRLPEAIATANAHESQRLAHTVKGAMRFFRAENACQCGLELENLAGTGDLTSAPELLERLQSEVERVLPVLQRFVDTGEM